MMTTLKGLLVAACLSIVSITSHASEDEIYTTFFSDSGAGGYDVVAYFTENMPVEGSDDFTVEYKNAEWYFSSQANLDKFNENPDMYVPQYGGYCAWAVANGDTASGDPLQWTVLNNRLYLNYDADIQAMWSADRENLIAKGDMNWPGVLN
jgi:YHS domain-containing protein